jgi:hypothetical protein
VVVTSSGGVIQIKVFPRYKLLVIRMEIRRSGDLVEFQIFEQHLSPDSRYMRRRQPAQLGLASWSVAAIMTDGMIDSIYGVLTV